MIVTIWVITAILLGLWSLSAWGLHGLLTLGPGWADTLGALIDRIPYGDLVEQWVPGWRGLLQALLDLVSTLLSALGSAAPLLVWGLWAGGALLLLLCAAGLTLMVVLLRGSHPTPRPAGTA